MKNFSQDSKLTLILNQVPPKYKSRNGNMTPTSLPVSMLLIIKENNHFVSVIMIRRFAPAGHIAQ